MTAGQRKSRWESLREFVSEWFVPSLLAALCLFGLWAAYDTSSDRSLTALESILFQILTLVAGILASLLIGRRQGKSSGKAQARSAFNRAVTIQAGIRELIESIESRREFLQVGIKATRGVAFRDVDAALDHLSSEATAQLREAGDAIKDWGELVPEDLAKLTPEPDKRERPSD